MATASYVFYSIAIINIILYFVAHPVLQHQHPSINFFFAEYTLDTKQKMAYITQDIHIYRLF